MKLRFLAPFCFSWAVLDVIATSLLFYKLHTETGLDDLKYNFYTSAVDFVILSLLRFALLFGLVFGIILNTVEGLARLSKANIFILCVLLMFGSYSPLKLLALTEVIEPQEISLFFWLIFSWNIVAAAVAGSLFIFCLPKISTHNQRPECEEVDEEKLICQPEEDQQSHNDDDEIDVEAEDQNASSNEEDWDLDDDKKNYELRKSASVVFRLLKYCGRAFSWYLFGTLFLLTYSADLTLAQIFIPTYMGDVINNIVVNRSYADLKQSILLMALVSVASSVSAGIHGGCFVYGGSLVNIFIRCDLFRSLTNQDIGFFDKTKTGEITSRLTADTQSMAGLIAHNLNIFLRTLIMFVGTLLWMCKLSWRLTTLNFVLMPVIVVICKTYGDYYELLSEKVQDTLAKTNEVAEEVIATMRTVRSFANEKREARRFDQRLYGTLAVERKQAICYALYNWIMELVDVLILVCILFYGGHLVLTDKMSSKQLITFLLYQLQFSEAISEFGDCFTGLMEAVGASHKVLELIDREPELLNDGQLKPEKFEGNIEFKNVQFSYPSRKEAVVLKNISFSVSPGEVVALVGPSGGGKSSCIALLENFYEPLSGSILIDGVPVQKYDHEFIHRKMALVAQEPVLYAESIRDNIAYALESHEWDDDTVKHAAKQANAHNFIYELPKGYDTGTGERGVQLSGGQKQRICLARALIRNPHILLLDEATSALDTESEYLVQQTFYSNPEGHTVLLIAHRLSTVEKADKIVVINHGQVEQIGTHKQLLASEGLYKDLVHRQLLEEKKRFTFQYLDNSDDVFY